MNLVHIWLDELADARQDGGDGMGVVFIIISMVIASVALFLFVVLCAVIASLWSENPLFALLALLGILVISAVIHVAWFVTESKDEHASRR